MNENDLITYAITIMAILFMFGKYIYQTVQRRRHPEEYLQQEKEQEDALKKFLSSLSDDMEEDVSEAPVVHRQPPVAPQIDRETYSDRIREDKSKKSLKDNYAYSTSFEAYKQKSAIEARDLKKNTENRYQDDFGDDLVNEELRVEAEGKAYDIVKMKDVARGQRLLNQLLSKKDMVIYHEILDKPKAFRM